MAADFGEVLTLSLIFTKNLLLHSLRLGRMIPPWHLRRLSSC